MFLRRKTFLQSYCIFQRWCFCWSNFWRLKSNHIPLRFPVSEMGLTTLIAQLVFILRAKSWKVFMRYQKSFFIFSGTFFSKHTYLKLEKYLMPSTYQVNSIFFRGIACFSEVMFLVKQFFGVCAGIKSLFLWSMLFFRDFWICFF